MPNTKAPVLLEIRWPNGTTWTDEGNLPYRPHVGDTLVIPDTHRHEYGGRLADAFADRSKLRVRVVRVVHDFEGFVYSPYSLAFEASGPLLVICEPEPDEAQP